MAPFSVILSVPVPCLFGGNAMFQRALIAVLLVLFLVLSVVGQAPTLDTVLARAGEYVTGYNNMLGLLIAEESSEQLLRPYGNSQRDLLASGAPLGEMGTPKLRKMRSEFALVAFPDAHAWMAFRDVFEVDGKALRPEKNRLTRAFTDTPQDALAMAQAFSDEALKYNFGVTKRGVNVPTFPLMALMPPTQPRFAFTKKSEKRQDNVAVWIIEFNETGRPTLSMTADGTPRPARGELSVEPASGRVVKTHLVFDALDAYPEMRIHPEKYATPPRATIDVTYRLDAVLKAWLPVEMQEAYNRSDEVVTCKLTYSGFRSLAWNQVAYSSSVIAAVSGTSLKTNPGRRADWRWR
jgi:hypothetical protein